MKLDSLPEAAEVTIFMEGLQNGVVFRVHPSSFEETGDEALNAELNFKSRSVWHPVGYLELN